MKKARDFLNPARSKRKSIQVSEKDVAKDAVRTELDIEYLIEQGMYSGERPQFRYECPIERPCPHVGCRYNLFLDVTSTGAIKFNFYGVEPWEITHSCALDLADANPEGINMTNVGKYVGLTRERVKQIETEALRKLRNAIGEEDLLDWIKGVANG